MAGLFHLFQRSRTRSFALVSFFQCTGPGSDKGNAAIVTGKHVMAGERAKYLTAGTHTVQMHWLQRLGKAG